MTHSGSTPPAGQHSSNEHALKKYRVVIESREYFVVDVLAPSAQAAMDCAEDIDGFYVGQACDSQWQAIEANLLGADEEFSPPDLPASAWTAR